MNMINKKDNKTYDIIINEEKGKITGKDSNEKMSESMKKLFALRFQEERYNKLKSVISKIIKEKETGIFDEYIETIIISLLNSIFY